MRRTQNTAKIFKILEEPQIPQLTEKEEEEGERRRGMEEGGREKENEGKKTMSLVNKLERIKLER